MIKQLTIFTKQNLIEMTPKTNFSIVTQAVEEYLKEEIKVRPNIYAQFRKELNQPEKVLFIALAKAANKFYKNLNLTQ